MEIKRRTRTSIGSAKLDLVVYIMATFLTIKFIRQTRPDDEIVPRLYLYRRILDVSEHEIRIRLALAQEYCNNI